jgi:hypothetical protein
MTRKILSLLSTEMLPGEELVAAQEVILET